MRKVPDTAPNSFIKKRWNNLIFKEDGSVDRQFYEFKYLASWKMPCGPAISGLSDLGNTKILMNIWWIRIPLIS